MWSMSTKVMAFGSAILTLGLFIALAVMGVVFMKKVLPGLLIDRSNTDFGQIFGGAIGTMFALVFALVTIAVWQNYDRVAGGVGDEANCIHNIYQYLETYPKEVRNPTRQLLQTYLKEVIEVEWPMQKEGRQDPAANALIAQIDARITTYRPATLGCPLPTTNH